MFDGGMCADVGEVLCRPEGQINGAAQEAVDFECFKIL
jgi:hypothetical protein